MAGFVPTYIRAEATVLLNTLYDHQDHRLLRATLRRQYQFNFIGAKDIDIVWLYLLLVILPFTKIINVLIVIY